MVTRWEITKAVRASDLPAPSRLIMLTLADVADTGTAEIPAQFTPSLTVLTGETGLSRSTVAMHLRALESDGWVVRVRPATAEALGRGERTRYQLQIPRPSSATGPVQEMDKPDLVREMDDPSAGADQPSAAPGQPSAADALRVRSSYLPDQVRSSSAPKAPKRRGTRIPDDFAVTPAMVTWAREKTPNVDGRRETEKFVNYWQAKSGAGATKLDWAATWRNWMLTAAERLPGNALTPSANGRASPKPSTTNQRVNQARDAGAEAQALFERRPS